MNLLPILQYKPGSPFFCPYWRNYRDSLERTMSPAEVERTIFRDYGARVIVDKSGELLQSWLEFEHEEDAVLFVLRWS